MMKTLFSPGVRLVNQLKYPQKFLVVGMVLVLPLSVVLWQYITQTNLVIDNTVKEQLGLEYAAPLTSFLQHVQQYAGIAYATAVSNDAQRTTFADLAVAAQARVETDIAAVSAVQDRLGVPLALGQRWDSIKADWTRIRTIAPMWDQHTALINYDDLIQQTLITIVGNNSTLILDADIDTYYLMDALINRIPLYGNYLSSIRNYGTAAAAQGLLRSTDRTRLIILLGQVQSAIRAQQTSIDYAVNYQATLSKTVSPALDNMVEEINSFLTYVNRMILGDMGEQSGDTPVLLDPGTFFTSSSKAVDSAFSFYSLLLVKENELLQQRLSNKLVERNGIILLTLAALAGAAYLFGAFYTGVRSAINSLSLSSERMIRGDMGEGNLKLESRDELADVVFAFNNIAHALSRSENQLRVILETSPIPMFAMNNENEVLYMNSVAVAMFGDKRVRGSSPIAEEFGVDATNHEKWQQQSQQQSRSEGYRRDAEINFRAVDGTLRYGLVSARPVQLSGQAALLIAIVDITALKQAQEAAEEANRVKSQFLANMSHELRTPLNAVLNFTGFVADGVFGAVNAEQADALQQSIAASKHLLSLINDILDLSKIEAGSMDLFIQEVDLNEALAVTVSVAKGLMKDKPLELITAIDEGLPHTYGDKRRIRQIFLNLVSNAVKFMTQGCIKIAAQREEDTIHVAVTDTGMGIALQDQALIFESFKQASNVLPDTVGTGLGLPISKFFVEAHGGKLWLDSELGKGSTFHVVLPIRSA